MGNSFLNVVGHILSKENWVQPDQMLMWVAKTAHVGFDIVSNERESNFDIPKFLCHFDTLGNSNIDLLLEVRSQNNRFAIEIFDFFDRSFFDLPCELFLYKEGFKRGLRGDLINCTMKYTSDKIYHL